jgi:hypothetical protein
MNTTNSPQGVSCIPRRLLLFSKRLRVPGCGVSVMRVGSVGYMYTERERERERQTEREREELSTDGSRCSQSESARMWGECVEYRCVCASVCVCMCECVYVCVLCCFHVCVCVCVCVCMHACKEFKRGKHSTSGHSQTRVFSCGCQCIMHVRNSRGGSKCLRGIQ